MTLTKKIAFSFILSLLLCAGFAVLAYTGLFDLVETRFYKPSVTRAALKEAEQDRELVQEYFAGLKDSFTGVIGERAVHRSFLPNRSDADVLERSRILLQLLKKQTGLQSIRFIDTDGSRVYYSTLPQDTLGTELSPAYRNYQADSENPPYDSLAVPAKGEPRLILDAQGERAIFSYPFYDALDIHRGTAVFTLSVSSLTEALIAGGRIKIGEKAVILADPPGIILGLSPVNRNTVLSPAAEIWKKAGNYRRGSGLNRLDPGRGNLPVVLLSSQTGEGIFTGRIVNENLFKFSPAMKLVLLASFFLTSFLTIFLRFNMRPEPMTIVRTRLRRIRGGILEEYRRGKNSALRFRSDKLEQRREDVRQEIKRNLWAIQAKRDKLLEKEIDAYIDIAWNELKAAIERLAPPPDTDAPSDAAGPPPSPPSPAAFAGEDDGPPPPKTHSEARARTAAGDTESREQTAELEPIEAFPQAALLSQPFTFTAQLNSSPDLLTTPRPPAGSPRAETGKPSAGEPVFKNKNGITYINKAYLTPNKETAENPELNKEFKDLVNSVMKTASKNPAAGT